MDKGISGFYLFIFFIAGALCGVMYQEHNCKKTILEKNQLISSQDSIIKIKTEALWECTIQKFSLDSLKDACGKHPKTPVYDNI